MMIYFTVTDNNNWPALGHTTEVSGVEGFEMDWSQTWRQLHAHPQAYRPKIYINRELWGKTGHQSDRTLYLTQLVIWLHLFGKQWHMSLFINK